MAKVNGTYFIIYLNSYQLLFSKSLNFSLNMDTPDASFKEPVSLGDLYLWEEVITNWEAVTFNWETGSSPNDGGWARVIAGQKDGSLSIDGLVEGTIGFTNWEDISDLWNVASFNWETEPGVGDLDSTLITYLLNKTKLSFEINVNGSTEFSGKCYITGYEQIAPNEDMFAYNLDLKVTSSIN